MYQLPMQDKNEKTAGWEDLTSSTPSSRASLQDNLTSSAAAGGPSNHDHDLSAILDGLVLICLFSSCASSLSLSSSSWSSTPAAGKLLPGVDPPALAFLIDTNTSLQYLNFSTSLSFSFNCSGVKCEGGRRDAAMMEERENWVRW